MSKFTATLMVLALTSALAQQPRTYIEGLDLSSPEKTTRLFLQSYEKSDYLTVYFTLSPKAQQGWATTLMTLDYGQILRGPQTAILEASGVFGPLDQSESLQDIGLQFDAIMLSAQKQKGLPFELKTSTVDAVKVQQNTATVTVQNTVVPRTLTFKLVRLKNLRWKVEQVLFAGSNSKGHPWALQSP